MWLIQGPVLALFWGVCMAMDTCMAWRPSHSQPLENSWVLHPNAPPLLFSELTWPLLRCHPPGSNLPRELHIPGHEGRWSFQQENVNRIWISGPPCGAAQKRVFDSAPLPSAIYTCTHSLLAWFQTFKYLDKWYTDLHSDSCPDPQMIAAGSARGIWNHCRN